MYTAALMANTVYTTKAPASRQTHLQGRSGRNASQTPPRAFASRPGVNTIPGITRGSVAPSRIAKEAQKHQTGNRISLPRERTRKPWLGAGARNELGARTPSRVTEEDGGNIILASLLGSRNNSDTNEKKEE